MRKEYSEEDLRNILGKTLEDSDMINSKMQEAYLVIRQNQHKKERTGLKRFACVMSGAAAALVLGLGFCMANPVMAAKIPVIGMIFQRNQEEVSYPGDYSEHAKQLLPAEEENSEKDSLYRQTFDGVTFTVSECYADQGAMYLGVSVEADQGFSEKILNASRNTDSGYAILEMDATAVADFSNAGYGKVYFDPAYGTEAPFVIEGNFIDNATFTGIIRIDLTNLTAYDEAGNIRNIETAPEQFLYEMNISNIYANEEIEGYRNNEIEKLSGEWSFSIEVSAGHADTIIKNINLTNEEGIGIGRVIKTAYEIEAELVVPENLNAAGYVIIMADAQGNPLDTRGEAYGTFNCYQQKTDKVTVGICDEETFFNYKGDFKELLNRAIFKTEVDFT